MDERYIYILSLSLSLYYKRCTKWNGNLSGNINLNSWNYNEHPLFKNIEEVEELRSPREATVNVVYVCKTSIILVLQRHTLIVASVKFNTIEGTKNHALTPSNTILFNGPWRKHTKLCGIPYFTTIELSDNGPSWIWKKNTRCCLWGCFWKSCQGLMCQKSYCYA